MGNTDQFGTCFLGKEWLTVWVPFLFSVSDTIMGPYLLHCPAFTSILVLLFYPGPSCWRAGGNLPSRP